MNKKVILTTVATIAAIATAGGVKADEVQGTTGAGDSTSAVTTSQSESIQNNQNTGTGPVEKSTTESGSTDQGSGIDDNKQQGAATEFSKHEDVIKVTNPEVVIDQSKGAGKYQGFTVEFKNVHLPDDMTINQGDKVTFNLPEEITFQTAYEFDVKNPDNNVVGKASTDPASQTVTTVFNDYFANHPLNKQMSLKLDAKWTDKVESGKPVTVNFNGTVVTAQIGAEQEIGKDELISKWGSQDKKDPTTINWTIRLNYARKTLNYVKIIDQMSDNQKLVDDYFVMNYVDSVDPWTDKGSAMDLIKSMAKSEHGFEITMDRLDRMVYIWYKTKLTGAVKDSTDPTNKVELKAENDGAVSKSSAHLVGGRGDAVGETKPEPTWEIPNEAPVYDKPSIDLKDIPLLPPAPIVEIPEWKGGVTPPDAPQIDKPEWQGGTVPFDAPVLDKPEINIEDIPMMPPAPILEKPELIIEFPEPKHDEPKLEPKHDKSNTPASKTETKKETVEVVNQGEAKQDEPIATYSAPVVLPATGTDLGLSLVALGISVATLAFTLKKKEN